MVRRSRTRPNRRQRRRRPIITRGRVNLGGRRSIQNSFPSLGGIMKVAREASALLPIAKLPDFIKLAEITFSFVLNVFQSKNYYRGAYAEVLLTPGALLLNSPLLAKDSNGKYSFPGYPVTVKWVNIKITNTTELQMRAGRWAAVFIPFKEVHDANHYATVLKTFTFKDVAAMPHAQVGPAYQDLNIYYRMRNFGDYCARPREMKEMIGMLYVIWDHAGRSETDIPEMFSNSDFSCDFFFSAGILPQITFGSNHRVAFPADDFSIKCLTSSQICKVINGDNVTIENFSNVDEYELVQADEMGE